MIYPLSHYQKQAVRELWNGLDYDVGMIVNSFINEGYPVKESQIIKVIIHDGKMSDKKNIKKSE